MSIYPITSDSKGYLKNFSFGKVITWHYLTSKVISFITFFLPSVQLSQRIFKQHFKTAEIRKKCNKKQQIYNRYCRRYLLITGILLSSHRHTHELWTKFTFIFQIQIGISVTKTTLNKHTKKIWKVNIDRQSQEIYHDSNSVVNIPDILHLTCRIWYSVYTAESLQNFQLKIKTTFEVITRRSIETLKATSDNKFN